MIMTPSCTLAGTFSSDALGRAADLSSPPKKQLEIPDIPRDMRTIKVADERAGFGIPRVGGGPCVVQPQEALACDFHDLQCIAALQFRRRGQLFESLRR